MTVPMLKIPFGERLNIFKILLVGILFFADNAKSQVIPPEADIQYKKGCAALDLGTSKSDFEIAEVALVNAINLAPNWPEPRYKLGIVYDRLEKHQQALDQLKFYLQLAPAGAPDRKPAEDLMYKVDFKITRAGKAAEVEQLLADGKWERIGAPSRKVVPFDIIKEANNWKLRAKCFYCSKEYPDLFWQEVPMSVTFEGFSFTYENARCPLVEKYLYCMETIKVNAKLISQDPLTYQVTETETIQSSGQTSTYNYQWKFTK
jgi:tetratricopeptide (TPR) repeat protein